MVQYYPSTLVSRRLVNPRQDADGQATAQSVLLQAQTTGQSPSFVSQPATRDFGSIIPLSQLVTSIAATSNRPALATTNQQPSLAASTNLTVTQLPNTSTHAEDWSNISSYGDSFQGFQARSPPSLSPEASLNFTEDNVTDVGNNFLIPQEIRDLLTSRRLGGGGRSNRHQLSHYFDAQLQNLRSAPAFRRDISVQEAGDLSVQEFTFPEANIFPYMVVTQPQIRLRHPSSSANIAAPTNLSATVARNNSKFNDLLSYASSKMKERKVYIISCIDCEKTVTYRGMRALLLANKKRSLYSSDSPILKAVSLAGEIYKTPSCECCLADIHCKGCGGRLGYHVANPCVQCLTGRNNGHLWMFFSEKVSGIGRLDENKERVTWESLQKHSKFFEGQESRSTLYNYEQFLVRQAFEDTCR